MSQIEKQLRFNAPVAKVWQIWTDVARTPEWVAGVLESRITGLVNAGKGLEWKEKCRLGSRVIEVDHEFTEFEPLRRTVIRSGLPMGGTLNRVAEFSEADGGTQVHVAMDWDLGIAAAFFDAALLQKLMEENFDQTAAQWKSRAEAV